MDGECLALIDRCQTRHEQYVFVSQCHILDAAVQYACKVDCLNLERAVGLHALEHGMSKESILSHTFCIFYELPHGLDLLAKLIKPRTEHRSAHLNCIAISLND